MKFHYSALLLIAIMSASPLSLKAREVILIENLASVNEGENLVNILQNKFSIPRKLITLKHKLACKKNTEAIMHLCLKANGELEIVKMNKFVVEETLGIFNDLEEL